MALPHESAKSPTMTSVAFVGFKGPVSRVVAVPVASALTSNAADAATPDHSETCITPLFAAAERLAVSVSLEVAIIFKAKHRFSELNVVL